MMTVAELAQCTGSTPHTIRYYTRMGLLSSQRNPNNGYHLYQQSDVVWLRFIQQAKSLGYTLQEISEIIKLRKNNHSPCLLVKKALQERIIENRRQLQALTALQHRMESALEAWEQIEDAPLLDQQDCICPLIESVDLSNVD